MKILVSGGAGYIGSVAVEQLIKQGHDVIVFDNLSQGHIEAVDELAIFEQGDLADKTLIDEVLSKYKPDAIMHFASYTLVGESMDHPFLYLRDNVVNGLNLIESAVQHQVQRFILSSTANLFDDPVQMPIDENERIVPGSPYGESKYILERTLHWMQEIYGLRFACLRYFNACGATENCGEDRDPETHIIPLVLDVALGKRESITIFGDDYDTPDGTCVRDYIHVSDLASAHILALHALEQNHSLRYNLGNGQGFSVKQVVETAREITGHPIPANLGSRRMGDPDILIAGSETINDELGWKPIYPSLNDMIRSAWEWRVKNPMGYK